VGGERECAKEREREREREIDREREGEMKTPTSHLLALLVQKYKY
jgi:hypothetical protein